MTPLLLAADQAGLLQDADVVARQRLVDVGLPGQARQLEAWVAVDGEEDPPAGLQVRGILPGLEDQQDEDAAGRDGDLTTNLQTITP